MQLSFTSLGILCLIAAIVWFWHDSLRARDIANAAAMAACERIGLQFLDGTAAFSRLTLTRGAGLLNFRRTYVFDYTSQSIERRQGFAILVGHQVEYVGFAPEHTAIAEAPRAEAGRQRAADIVDVPSGTADGANNVLDLNEHRARRSTIDGESTPKSDRAE